MHTSVRVITSKTRDEMEREVPNIRDLIMEDTTQAEMAQAVTVQTSWDLSGVPSVGIGNLAMKDRSR